MRFFLIATALFFAQQASAATYTYTGQTMRSPPLDPPDVCDPQVFYRCDETRVIHGGVQLNFDTRNATMILRIEDISGDDDPEAEWLQSLTVTGPKPISKTWTSHDQDWSPIAKLFSIKPFEGDFHDLIYPVAYDGQMRLTFDGHGRVIDWEMWATTGGSADWSSTPLGDGDFDLHSDGPGKWTGSEVPLPATLPLLAAALVSLGCRRRSSRAPTCPPTSPQ